MATKTRATRDWELFVDWCASRDEPSLPTTAAIIAEFLIEFPAPKEAQTRRVKAIRKAHENAGKTLTIPAAERASVVREGAEWAPMPRALAQVPKWHHPKDFAAAVRGRRDGWLLVLVGVIGLSRKDARGVTEDDVKLFPRLAVKGVHVLRAEPAAECPACAVTRWFRIARPVSFGFTDEIKALVSPTDVDPDDHDCHHSLDGTWRKASTLLPQVDRRGYASHDPMSVRSISTVVVQRQALGLVAEIKARLSSTERAAVPTLADLATAYDQLDDADKQVTAANRLLESLLRESAETLGHLKENDR